MSFPDKFHNRYMCGPLLDGDRVPDPGSRGWAVVG